MTKPVKCTKTGHAFTYLLLKERVANDVINVSLPAALRAAQTCRYYLIYAEADFAVFRPAGATRCTDGGEIWHGGGCNDKGAGPPKLKFLLRFDRNVEYKRPAGFSQNLHSLYLVLGALGIKILLDLLNGLWSYGGLKLVVSGCCQIFSGP